MNIQTTCPACGVSKKFPHVAIVQGNSHEDFNLYRCSKCGLLFVYPVPEIQRHFHKELTGKPWPQESLKRAMEDYSRRVLKDSESWLFPGARILDFGCGFGHFLAAAKEAGYYAEGVDISPGCRKYIAKYLPDVVVYPQLDDIPIGTEKYDLVTTFEVLYYMLYPRKSLYELKSLLRPGGSIIVVVSANRGWLIWLLSRIKLAPVKLGDGDWMTSALLNGRAYYAFSIKSLIRLMESVGFTNIRTSRLQKPATERIRYRIPLFIWWGCVRILWVLSLGKVDLHTRAHVIGRYAPKHKAQGSPVGPAVRQ